MDKDEDLDHAPWFSWGSTSVSIWISVTTITSACGRRRPHGRRMCITSRSTEDPSCFCSERRNTHVVSRVFAGAQPLSCIEPLRWTAP